MTEAPIAPESRFVDVDGLQIHYQETGSGHPLVMLHGTGPGASGWSNFRRTVPAFAGDYRVVVPDLPRFGRSSKVPITGPRLTLLSGIIDRFLDAIGVETAHFIGNSMGGQVAMKLAIDHPDRVGRVVVIGSPPLGASSMAPSPAEGIRMIEGYYKGSGPSLDKMRAIVQALVFDQRFATEEVIRARYEASIDPEVIQANAGPLWERESLEGQLQQVAAPMLLIWGQDDRFAQLDIALRMVRELPNARLLVFSRCGHWAQLEHEAEFNSVVRNFLTTGL
jgi:4,5:9,10-diseco-3-hydroxy-5,9,17-trioxoandrosta-1(10),2-diene-4-oate hydrolase